MWAVAHPVRLRIFHLLRQGPATAAQLGRATGESRGTTSYHLRMLERSGAIVEDEGLGTRRERYWRRVDPTGLIPTPADAEGREITARLFGIFFARDDDARQRFMTRDVPGDWHEAAFAGNWFLALTPHDARELGLRLMNIIDEYRQRVVTDGDQALVSVSVLPWLDD